MMWNWQQPDWPHFSYDPSRIEESEKRLLLGAGLRFGAFKHLGEDDKRQLTIELISNEATCRLLATPGTPPRQYQVSSWGKMLTAHTLPTGDSITIAAHKLPIRQVTYITGMHNAQVERMTRMGIGGMAGNKLFLQSILVLDTRQGRFGIVNR